MTKKQDYISRTNTILLFAIMIIFIWWMVLLVENRTRIDRIVEMRTQIDNLEQQNRILELCTLDVVECEINNN